MEVDTFGTESVGYFWNRKRRIFGSIHIKMYKWLWGPRGEGKIQRRVEFLI